MATVKSVLSALLFGGNQPSYQIKCNHTAISNSLFHKISLPVRLAAAKLLHPYHCLASLNFNEDNRLLVATWPTYANESFIHVVGYTYAIPSCAKDLTKRHGVFESLVEYLGGHVLHDEGFMPPDYLSHSVAGAQITLSTTMGKANVTKGVSGEYGHFETFGRHDEPFQTLDMALSTTDCPLDDSLRSTHTHTTAQVLASHGVTIVSDVDDILREAEVWNLKQMLLNTFARPFRPWSDNPWQDMSIAKDSGMQIRIRGQPLGSMPRLYQHWAHSISRDIESNIHFHYVSEAPEMSHEFYVNGINEHYPAGSFDFRPMVLDTYNAFAKSRYDNIRRLIESFPQRHFILVGDTSTPSLLRSYLTLAKEFDQIQCILIRDTSATEPANWFQHNFGYMPNNRYLVFDTPHELLTDPRMNITKLLRLLSRFEGVGHVSCGESIGQDSFERDAGKYALLETAQTLVKRSFACWLLTLSGERPSKDCYFDRRGFLKYPPV